MGGSAGLVAGAGDFFGRGNVAVDDDDDDDADADADVDVDTDVGASGVSFGGSGGRSLAFGRIQKEKEKKEKLKKKKRKKKLPSFEKMNPKIAGKNSKSSTNHSPLDYWVFTEFSVEKEATNQ